ncbi:MAG TPA: hypothetical protein VGJ20_09840 [Xanthobacteraceae bacterium]|jgi:hypothetical protein
MRVLIGVLGGIADDIDDLRAEFKAMSGQVIRMSDALENRFALLGGAPPIDLEGGIELLDAPPLDVL